MKEKNTDCKLKDIDKAANQVKNQERYFEYKYINYNLLIDILFNTLNKYEITKIFINHVMKLFFKIIKLGIENNKRITIFKFGSFGKAENNVYFNLSDTIYKLINYQNNKEYYFDKFSIFELKKIDNEIKILDIKKHKTKSYNLFPEKKKNNKKIENININIKPWIKILNKDIIIELIRKHSGIKHKNKNDLIIVINQFLKLFLEASLLGINIKLEVFGDFFPIKINDKKKDNYYLLYKNGKFKEVKNKGSMTVGFKYIN